MMRAPLWASLALALGACQHAATVTDAASPDTTAAPAAATAPADTDSYGKAQTYYQVLLGQLAQQRGDNQIALSNLLAAAETSRDLNLAKQAFGLALKQRDAEATLRAANLLAALDPQNAEALMALALAQFQNGQPEPARASLAQALNLVGDREDSQLALVGKFARAGGPGTLPVLAELAREHPRPEWLLLAAAVQAQHFGDGPYAMALLDRATELAPDYRRAVLVKAELLAQRDGDAAIALLDEQYRAHPGERDLAVSYGRLLYSQGRFPEAVEVLRGPARQEDDGEASYLFAVSQFMAGQWADALPRLQAIAESGNAAGPAGWLCGQAAERLKQAGTALTCYDRVQPGDSQYVLAQRARAELLARAKRLDEALEGLREARLRLEDLSSADSDEKLRLNTGLLVGQLRLMLQGNRLADAQALLESEPVAYREQPEPALLVAGAGAASPALMVKAFERLRPESEAARRQWALTAAGLLQDAGATNQALALLTTELDQQPDQIPLLYARALLAESLNQVDLAEADLRRVLALAPNNIDALNALGYTLADRNRNLDEAHNLIDRALRERPTSAAIMDSMGWLLYRRGETARARDWLQRAYGLEPEAEIAAHYGEVLYTLGEKKKARQIWRDALEQNPDSKPLRAVIERLK